LDKTWHGQVIDADGQAWSANAVLVIGDNHRILCKIVIVR